MALTATERETYRSVYQTALDADNAFQAELVRVYGKRRAADMRYALHHTDPGLLAARANKHEADEVHHAWYQKFNNRIWE